MQGGEALHLLSRMRREFDECAFGGDIPYALPKNDCPWDSLLEYRSPQLEEQYLQTQHKSWCTADFWFYTMVLLGSISWLLLQSSSTQPMSKSDDISLLNPLESVMLLNCWVAISILGTIALVRSSMQQKGPYKSYEARLSFVPCLRILFSAVYATFACVAGFDKNSEEEHVLMVLGVHKSIVPLLVPCICLRLPQKRNIITQGLATLVVLLGFLMHSKQSVADPVIMGALNEAGNTAEEFLLYTVTLGIPSGLKHEKSQFPWWMVIVFYQVLWGFIVPIAGSYLAEAHSRAVFVNAIQWEWHEKQADQYFKDSVCGMIFVILIIVQLLWFSLREWEWHQAS